MMRRRTGRRSSKNAIRPLWQLAAMSRWTKNHPSPNPDDPPGKKHDYYPGLLKQTVAWVKARPNLTYIWRQRLDAMVNLDDLPPADVEAAADDFLRVAEKNAGPRGAPYYQYLGAAEALSKRRLQPARIVEVARKALAQWEKAEPMSDLYATKENVAGAEFYRALDWLRGAGLATGGHLALKQMDAALAELARMDEHLRSLKNLAGEKPEYKKEYSKQIAAWWGLMARAAQLQNRQLDAMAFYQNALMARIEAQQKPEPGFKDDLEANAHQLWITLGGTSEGWRTWYGRPADALAKQATLTWDEANEPFPAFQLTDLKGKTWNLASLKGRVSVLNFWASWCGYCREELPRRQKLTERYKDRDDVQFLTVNLDENPGLIERVMRQYRLSLTVLPAYTFATETLNVVGLPQNWIVDANGVVRLKGYSQATETWETGMIQAIEKFNPESSAR